MLTVARSGNGDGSVTSQPAGIDCGADCSEAYAAGMVVTLTPQATLDSTFMGWSGDADCGDGQVTLAGDASCTATFDCVQDLVLSDMTLAGGELNAAMSIVTGPSLVLDGSAAPVVLKAGEMVAFGDGTAITGNVVASIEANPCQ
jgi:hypothetical protein